MISGTILEHWEIWITDIRGFSSLFCIIWFHLNIFCAFWKRDFFDRFWRSFFFFGDFLGNLGDLREFFLFWVFSVHFVSVFYNWTIKKYKILLKIFSNWLILKNKLKIIKSFGYFFMNKIYLKIFFIWK